MSDNGAFNAGPLHEPIWAVGLMTGTVLDGQIDVALVKTDGQSIAEFGEYALRPYQPETVELLREALQEALVWQFKGPLPAIFTEVEKRLTEEQSDAVSWLVNKAGLSHSDIGAIGFHGQTVLHRAPVEGVLGATCQLGDGALMAKRLGISVVNDFRSADMRHGGQGAPLCGIYHQALLRGLDASGKTAVLNLGGIGNISYWDGDELLIAFDTGPANAPINDLVREYGLGDMDKDGALAAAGHVNEVKLQTLLQHPYFEAPYPKSLDRFDFPWTLANEESPEDGAALLTALCAAAVGKALDSLPGRPERLIVCGGGRRNASLLEAIRLRADVVVEPAEHVGWRGDAIEAECFAFLAARKLAGLPISFPTTSGVSRAMVGGVVHMNRIKLNRLT